MKKEKKAHGVQLLIRCVVRDPDGKVISDTGEKKARSFLIQWLEAFYGAARGGIGAPFYRIEATDVAGTEQWIYMGIGDIDIQCQLNAGVNVSAYGIVIGTGDTAPTNTDYKLETQLTEGVGAGNITHGAVSIGAAAVVGANVDMELIRAFTNLTGSTITVKEAGAYIRQIEFTKYHCIIRDVLGTPVEVPDKCSLAIIYTMRTTV